MWPGSNEVVSIRTIICEHHIIPGTVNVWNDKEGKMEGRKEVLLFPINKSCESQQPRTEIRIPK